IVREGFTRVKVDGKEFLLDEGIPDLDKKFKHTIEVVIDRLVMKADLRTRLWQSIETAATLAEGLVGIHVIDGQEMLFSQNFACPDHGVSLAELQPRIFSFNAPHGACPRCTGLGSQQEIDPDLVVPDPSLSIDDGALVPWSVGGSSGFYEAVIQAIADRYEIDTSKAWSELTEPEQDRFLDGTDGEKVYVQYRNRMGRRRQYMLAFDGIVASLQRRYRETEQLIGHRILKEIRERLTFLDDVGVGYLTLDRAAATLSGGEAQRLRLATQIGSQLVGVLYILDEPSIGLHQRDNARLIDTLERLRDIGNTVLVVEHDEEMMLRSDWLVDM